jgi:hypothetical protein
MGDHKETTSTYLSTSRPFLLFATMSNKKGFSPGPLQKEALESYGQRREVELMFEGSLAAMSALMNYWSFIGIGMMLSSTR